MYDLFLLSNSILDLNLDQFEYEIFCADIVEGNLIRSRFKRPDSFKCRFFGCQRVVGEQGCHDLDVGLSFSVAGQRHCRRVFIRFYGTVLLDHDLRRVLLEVVGNGGIDQVGHFLRRGVIICAHRIADVSESVAGEGVFDIILLVLHFFARAGALGDQLAVRVHLMFCSFLHHHEFDGVGHEAGAALGFIVEGHGCIARQVTMRNRYLLLVGLLGRHRTVEQIGAHRVIAVDVRCLDRHALARLEEVFVLITVGRTQFDLASGAGVFAEQLNRDGSLAAVQHILEVDHCMIVRLPRPIRLTGGKVITHAGHIRHFDGRLRAADGGHGIGPEGFDIAVAILVALEVHRHSDIALIIVLLIPEDDGLAVLVLQEVGCGVEVGHRGIVRYGLNLSGRRTKGVALAGRQILDLLLPDLCVGVHILLDDRDIPGIAGVGVGHNDLAVALILVGIKVILLVHTVDRHAHRRGGSRVILDGGGFDLAGQIDLVALGHGAAVLAVKLRIAIAGVHSHHRHIARVLGVGEGDGIVPVVGGDGRAGLGRRVASDGGGADRDRNALFQGDLALVNGRAVVYAVHRHIHHVVHIDELDLFDGVVVVVHLRALQVLKMDAVAVL